MYAISSLSVLALSSILSLAHAVEPDGSGGSGYESGELGESGDSELSPYEEACQIIDGIRVCGMKPYYCLGDENHYDCDDFAWCFDDVCESLDIPSWELAFGCENEYTFVKETPPHESVFDYWCAYKGDATSPTACWFQDPSEPEPTPPDHVNVSQSWGHAINIVQIPSPTDSVFDYYCLVEPQRANNPIITCWYQDSAVDGPEVPDFAFEEVCAGDISWSRIVEDGHHPNAGEDPFTTDPDMVDLYEEVTQYPAPE